MSFAVHVGAHPDMSYMTPPGTPTRLSRRQEGEDIFRTGYSQAAPSRKSFTHQMAMNLIQRFYDSGKYGADFNEWMLGQGKDVLEDVVSEGLVDGLNPWSTDHMDYYKRLQIMAKHKSEIKKNVLEYIKKNKMVVGIDQGGAPRKKRSKYLDSTPQPNHQKAKRRILNTKNENVDTSNKITSEEIAEIFAS